MRRVGTSSDTPGSVLRSSPPSLVLDRAIDDVIQRNTADRQFGCSGERRDTERFSRRARERENRHYEQVVSTPDQRRWPAWLPLAATCSWLVAIVMSIVGVITGGLAWLVIGAIAMGFALLGLIGAVLGAQGLRRHHATDGTESEP